MLYQNPAAAAAGVVLNACGEVLLVRRAIEDAKRNIREAIELYIETLTEDGLPIPEEDILIKPIEIGA